MNSVISLTLFCLTLNAITLVLCTSQTAFYIDNGFGQTELDRDMTKQEKRELEFEILNLLGLPNKPRKLNKGPLKKSAPRFLLDIYKSLMEEEDENNTNRAKRSSDLNLSGEEQKQIEKSDLIMTFESISHHVSSVRHERGKRLWFNVSEVPVAEDIVGAELRIYQKESVSQKLKDVTQYTVTAFQLIKTEEGERELEYISAVNTTAGFSGWLGLNLTACLATWVAFPESNKGLYLSVHPTDKPGHEIRPEDIGLVTIKGEDETQPFMVAFLKATNHVRARRSVGNGRTRVKKSPPFTYAYKNSDSSHSCQINTLYISFRDLKWQDWIIAPEGYAAHYCAGECSFPLTSSMNATNHAIVQTLVHLMTPLKFPKPCCAPTKLSPTSVLYFLDDSNVVLKKYMKMVVKSCGCL